MKSSADYQPTSDVILNAGVDGIVMLVITFVVVMAANRIPTLGGAAAARLRNS